MRLITLTTLILSAASPLIFSEGGIDWVHLSSKRSELPEPGGSNQQTGLLVAKLSKTPAADIVISYRQKGPALVWYQRQANRWIRNVIEDAALPLEAGGCAHDIDEDGDLDIVWGGDAQSEHMWWWENPYPKFDPETPWRRHVIKNSGAKQHHDQIFADVLGRGKPQLIFWNQQAKTIFLAEIPSDPRNSGPWPLRTIYSGQVGEGVDGAAAYPEGIDAVDVDGDGRIDILAGNSWFKHVEGDKFQAIRISRMGGRIRAGRFKPSKYAQIVIAPGDGNGPLRLYECQDNAVDSACWKGRDLLDREMVHGHTLDIGDIDGDGHLDILAAEMAKWTTKPELDNPRATAWLLFGDGKGDFFRTALSTGEGWHEGKLADADGDGDIDVVNKPYTWDAPRIDVWLNNGTGRLRKGR
jgi:hypothetical protein